MDRYGVQKCVRCKSEIAYSMDYDAYYCPKCNEWLEAKCGQKDCIYCINRPDKPNKN